MGKRGNQRARGGRGRGRGRGGGQRPQRADYEEVPKTNHLFETYYNTLPILAEEDRGVFWEALRRDLPNSFRFTGSKSHAIPVRQRLKDHYIPEISGIEFNGEPVDPPTPISWYPDQLAWQMTTSKQVVRRSPPFASFQKYLVSETSVGNISRQEAVSMIPPLFMGVKPGMTVLDMCAAPGSKTVQLIEWIHDGEEARLKKVVRDTTQDGAKGTIFNGASMELDGDMSDDGRATGLLIANDMDYKRAHMLIHQVKRLSSPNLIVTNHDATMFPSIKLPPEPSKPQNRYLKYDRILADVPCSGDGTARKNINIWKDWNPMNALGLFATQVRILVRALQLLKVKGQVVYSTCSMNPVENEAVIAAAIDRCGGSSKVNIIDCAQMLPSLKRQQGMKSWDLMDKKGRIWHSWSEVEQAQSEEGPEGFGKLAEGMFPPSDGDVKMSLERCMRVYPHLQDTGAFFITVLKKMTEIRAKPESETKKTQPKPPIMSIVDEIDTKPVNGMDIADKVDAMDDILPPQQNGEEDMQSTAARQNQENAPEEPVTGEKRKLETELDALQATKRLKTREPGDAVEDPNRPGMADRQVHWPPPPGAELELTRPEMEDAPKPAPALSTQSRSKPRPNGPFEEPFKYLSPDHPELQLIQQFYNLSSKFPLDRFMVRNAEGKPVKTIYYTSALARGILTENEGSGLKFVHCGIKMFVKQDVQSPDVCRWRIQSEGMPLLESYVGADRVVKLWKRETLRKLLIEMFPKVENDGWRDLGEIGERVRDAGQGCYVLEIEPREGEDSFSERIVLPLWRSNFSLNLMLPKEDRKAMLLRLYNDDTPLMDHSKDRFKKPPNGSSDPIAPDPVSDNEADEVAEKEAEEKLAAAGA